MRVAFYLAGMPRGSRYLEMAEQAVAKVREMLPDALLVQHTDFDTDAVLGVDEVVRSDFGPPFLSRVKHLGNEGEVVSFSIDGSLRRLQGMQELLAESFDVAMAPDLSLAVSKNPQFWAEMAREMESRSEKDQWICAQWALNRVRGRFNVLAL